MPHKLYEFIASIRQKISGTDSSSHYEDFGARHHYPEASVSNHDNRLLGPKKNDKGYGSLSERKCKGRYDDQSSLLSDNEDSSYNAMKSPATKSSKTIKDGIKSFCTIS